MFGKQVSFSNFCVVRGLNNPWSLLSFSAMETEGNVFRCFKTQKDAILPNFDRWRPTIHKRFLLHAYHSSQVSFISIFLIVIFLYVLTCFSGFYTRCQANSELNDMVEHYEGLLLSREQDICTWKGKFSSLEADLRSLSDSKQKLEDQVDLFSTELKKSNAELQDQYRRHDKLQDELSVARGRLSESKSAAYTLNNQFTKLEAKYKAITKLRDAELAKSAAKARNEVKGRGMELIQGAILFIQTEQARSELESDIKEHESNLLLLDQIHKDDFSEEQERSDLKAVLYEKRIRLAALPASSFNPQHFEEFFTQSPPLGESGLNWAGKLSYLKLIIYRFLLYIYLFDWFELFSSGSSEPVDTAAPEVPATSIGIVEPDPALP